MGLVINPTMIKPLTTNILATAPSSLSNVFRFTANTLSKPLSFPSPTIRSSAITHSRFKRARPVTDVDGNTNITSKKKRRLRLHLITSRLSRPFSQPPTHIVDRGSSKIAVWAKQRALGRNLLRKAAILNSVRRSATQAAAQRQKIERERLACLYQYGMDMSLGAEDGLVLGGLDGNREERRCVPRRDYTPLPPSPLGLSNYDALDLEDDFYDEADSDDGDSNKGDGGFYSDFNNLTSHEVEDEDGEYTDPFSVLPTEIVREKPGPSPDGKVVEMQKEKERQREMMFVNLSHVH